MKLPRGRPGADACIALDRVWASAADRVVRAVPPEIGELSRAMVEAIELGGADVLVPLWAKCRRVSHDSLTDRALSEVFARYAPDLEDGRWLPLLDLISQPRSGDRSTTRNCLVTFQRHAKTLRSSRSILAREFGPFLLYALGHGQELVAQVTDTLIALTEAGSTEHLLTERPAHELAERLRTQAADFDPSVAQRALEVASELMQREFPREYPPVEAFFREYLVEDKYPSDRDSDDGEWSSVIKETNQVVTEFLRETSVFDEMTEEAAMRRSPIHALRATGGAAERGRLRVECFERLLRVWRQLYSDVRSTVAGDVRLPTLDAFAPSRGSFVVTMLIQAKTEEHELEARTADAIAAAIGANADFASMGEPRARHHVALLRLAAEYNVDLELCMVIPAPAPVRHRIRFGRARGRELVAHLATLPLEAGGQTEVRIGVLDGANWRTGTFEMRPSDGGDSVVGMVPKARRTLLLDRALGETYEFDLRPPTNGSTSDPGWELIRMSLPSVRPATIARSTRELLGPLPALLTPASLPRVDSFERITQIVEVVASGKVPSPATIAMNPRAIDDHVEAACILHLLAEEGTLLPAGATLVALPESRRLAYLAIQFEVSLCGRAWLEWSGATCVGDLDSRSAEQFLREKSVSTTNPASCVAPRRYDGGRQTSEQAASRHDGSLATYSASLSATMTSSFPTYVTSERSRLESR